MSDRILTWAVVGVGAAFGLLSLAGAGVVLTDDAPGSTRGLSLAAGVILLAGVIVLVMWGRRTRELIARQGGDVRQARHWAFNVWTAAVLLSIALSWFSNPDDSGLRIAFFLLRAVAAAALIAGTLIVHGRVQALLASPAGPPRDPLPPPGPRGMGGVPPAQPQPEDWNAGSWDPDVQADIELRRRRSGRD